MPKTVDEITSPPLPEPRAYIVGDRGQPVRRWAFLRVNHPKATDATDDLVDEACEALNHLRNVLCKALSPDAALVASPTYQRAERALARVCQRARDLAVRASSDVVEVAGATYYRQDDQWQSDGEWIHDEEVVALLDAVASRVESAAVRAVVHGEAASDA